MGVARVLFGRDLAVDLGTANTLVYVRGRGIVLNQPSVVALDSASGAVLAVGEDARQMVGRTPGHVCAIRPLRDGVITDFDVTEKMLRHFIRAVIGRRPALLTRPRAVVCVPSGVTGLEQRAVEEATVRAGARSAYIIEEPMAAAIGAGMPVHEAAGSMIVDIGGGTTEVAVISLGGIVASASIRVAGDELDEAIVSYIKSQHALMLGERTAEEIKLAIGSAHPMDEPREAEIRGRDLVSGLPKRILVTDAEVRKAMEEPIAAVVAAVRETLERTPRELAADIVERGVVMAGGGALLARLPERLEADLGIPVTLAARPFEAVAEGSGRCLEEFETLERVLISSSRY